MRLKELIKFQDTWDSDLDVHCLYILPQDFLKQYFNILDLYFFHMSELNITVGRQLEICFYKSNFKVFYTKTDITIEEFNALQANFEDNYFGTDVITKILTVVKEYLPEEEFENYPLIKEYCIQREL